MHTGISKVKLTWVIDPFKSTRDSGRGFFVEIVVSLQPKIGLACSYLVQVQNAIVLILVGFWRKKHGFGFSF